MTTARRVLTNVALLLALLGFLAPAAGDLLGTELAASMAHAAAPAPTKKPARAKKPRRRRKPRRARKPKRPKAPVKAEEDGPKAEEDDAPEPTLQRSNRMELDARLVRGETARSGAVYLFQRAPRRLPALVTLRQSFLDDITVPVLGRSPVRPAPPKPPVTPKAGGHP